MTARGMILICLRLFVFVIWMSGLLLWPEEGPVVGGAACVLAVVAYTFLPRPRRPEGAMIYNRASAVVIADWMGIVLGSLMLALPVWAAPEMSDSAGVHPMAWLVWPMGLGFLSFSVIAWYYDCFTLEITAQGLRIETAWRHDSIAWADIERVGPWRRDVPRWMRRLVPMLVMTGNPTQAGAILMARDSKGMSIERKGAAPFVISVGGFEENAKRLLAEFMRRDVEIGRGLSYLKPARSRRRSKRERK